MKTCGTTDTVLCKLRVSTTCPTSPSTTLSSKTFRPAVTNNRKWQPQHHHHHHHHHHHRTLVFNGISANSWLFPIGIRHSSERWKISRQESRPRTAPRGAVSHGHGTVDQSANGSVADSHAEPVDSEETTGEGEALQSCRSGGVDGEGDKENSKQSSNGCDSSVRRHGAYPMTCGVSQREAVISSTTPLAASRTTADTTNTTTTTKNNNTSTTTATTTTSGSASEAPAAATLTPEEFDSVWERVSHRPKSTGSVFITRRRNLPTGIGRNEYLQGKQLRAKYEEEESTTEDESNGDDTAATGTCSSTARVSSKLKPRPFTAPGTRKPGYRSWNQERLWSSRAQNRPLSHQVARSVSGVGGGGGGGREHLLSPQHHHHHNQNGVFPNPALPFSAGTDLVITPLRFSTNTPSEAWGEANCENDGSGKEDSAPEDTATTRLRSARPVTSSSSRSTKTKSATFLRPDPSSQPPAHNNNNYRKDVTDVDTINGIKRSYLRRAKSAPPKVRSADNRSSSSSGTYPTSRGSGADPSPNSRGPSLYWRARSAYHKRLLIYGHDEGPDPNEQSYNPCGSMWRPLMASGVGEDSYDETSMQHSAGCPYRCKGCFKACLVSEEFLDKARAEKLQKEKEREESARHRWGGGAGGGPQAPGASARCLPKHPPHKPRAVKVQDPQNIVSIAIAKSQPLYKFVHEKQAVVVTVPKGNANAGGKDVAPADDNSAVTDDERNNNTNGVGSKGSGSDGDGSDSSHVISNDDRDRDPGADVTSEYDETDAKSKTPKVDRSNVKFKDDLKSASGVRPENGRTRFTAENHGDESKGINSGAEIDVTTHDVTKDDNSDVVTRVDDDTDAKNITTKYDGSNSKNFTTPKHNRTNVTGIVTNSKYDASSARGVVTSTRKRIGNARPVTPKVNGSDVRSNSAPSSGDERSSNDASQRSDNSATNRVSSGRQKLHALTTSKGGRNSSKLTQEITAKKARRDERAYASSSSTSTDKSLTSDIHDDDSNKCSSDDQECEFYNSDSHRSELSASYQKYDVNHSGDAEHEGDVTHGKFAGKSDVHPVVDCDANRISSAHKDDVSDRDAVDKCDVNQVGAAHKNDVNHTSSDENHTNTVRSYYVNHTNTAHKDGVNLTVTTLKDGVKHENTARNSDAPCAQKSDDEITTQNDHVNQTRGAKATGLTYESTAHKIDDSRGITAGLSEVNRAVTTRDGDSSRNCDVKDANATQVCDVSHEGGTHKSGNVEHESVTKTRDVTFEKTAQSVDEKPANSARGGDVSYKNADTGCDANSACPPCKDDTTSPARDTVRKDESKASRVSKDYLDYVSNVRKGAVNASNLLKLDTNLTNNAPYDYDSHARAARIGEVSRTAKTPYSYHHQNYVRFNGRVTSDKGSAAKPPPPPPNNDKNRVSNPARKVDGN